MQHRPRGLEHILDGGLPRDRSTSCQPVDLDRFYAGIHPEDRALMAAAMQGAMDPDGPGRYAVECRTVSL